MPTLPLTERAAMARRIAASRVSSVLSGVGRGQRAAVAVRSAAMIPVRTSGGRLAHDATSRARSASGGALPPSAVGRDVGGTDPPVGPPVRPRPAPRLAPGAARAAPGAARCSESAYSPGDSASARGFDSPRLHSSDPPPRALFPSSPAPGGGGVTRAACDGGGIKAHDNNHQQPAVPSCSTRRSLCTHPRPSTQQWQSGCGLMS